MKSPVGRQARRHPPAVASLVSGSCCPAGLADGRAKSRHVHDDAGDAGLDETTTYGLLLKQGAGPLYARVWLPLYMLPYVGVCAGAVQVT